MKKKKTAPHSSGTTQSSSKPVSNLPSGIPPIKQPAPAATSAFKGFILLVLSVIALVIFFGLEPNKLWFNERIMSYWEDYKEQKLNLDPEERKLARFQTDYLFAKDVTAFFEKRGSADKVLVLLPPTDYFTAHGLNIHVVEPTVFYYLTGLKTIWPYHEKATKANWMITANNGRLVFDSVISQQALLDTIAAFKKYKYSL